MNKMKGRRLVQVVVTILQLFLVCCQQSIISTFALAATSTPLSSTNTYLDIERLQTTIANGRVYQHEKFINETQVQAVLNDIDRLRKENIMKPSGLSNTLKKQNQNFGDEDRTTAPAPWWKSSLEQQQHHHQQQPQHEKDEGVCQSQIDNEEYSDVLKSVIEKIQNLRTDVATILNRQSMNDPTLSHECYYSRSTVGAFLPRHMDERHEELKGPRGWMLPSRRSISWLIYLSDEDLVGGELRTFPQKDFYSGKHGILESGCHDGNLQIGWVELQVESSGSTSETLPVYLDSWYQPKSDDDAAIPLCILYTVSGNNDEIIYITKPWSNDAVTMSTADFLKEQAAAEAQKRSNQKQASFFTNEIYAKGFRLLEDRQAWLLESDESTPPYGSETIDVAPKRGSLVMFDSVTLPHEVLIVEKNTRSALAGWFHEETQEFPMSYP